MNHQAAWIFKRVEDFFLRPASALPLAALRIGVALTLLTQAFLVRGEVLELFSSSGYVQGALALTTHIPGTPTVAGFTSFLLRFGIAEDVGVYVLCSAYVVGLIGMALGLLTRPCSVVAWLIHWMLMNANDTSNYGADLFGQIFLFYLMVVPAGAALSLDVFFGRIRDTPRVSARLGLRLMQLHLCIMYLASGLEKATGVQWWNGDLLWRALNTPVYQQFDMSWLIDYPLVSQLAGWTTLLFELGYAAFIWPRATRLFWVVSMVGLHLGIAVFMGLGVFGSLMAVMTPALFAVSAEPDSRLAQVLRHISDPMRRQHRLTSRWSGATS